MRDRMILDINNPIRIEKAITYHNKKDGTKRATNYKVYIFKCLECPTELRVQGNFLKKHSGLCVKCAQFGLPYISGYNSLLKSARTRKLENTLTYEQFVTFTNINKCHYCESKIVWYEHTKHNNKNIKEGRSYKLDRKDTCKGYSLENCVVCCWRCNAAKSNRYTYTEWYGMTAYLRNLTS